MGMQLTTWNRMRNAFANLEPFTAKGNALRGWVGSYVGTGRMPEPHATRYRDEAEQGLITYTVLSYATPIAWVLESGELVCPDVFYSRTTVYHQGQAQAWLVTK